MGDNFEGKADVKDSSVISGRDTTISGISYNVTVPQPSREADVVQLMESLLNNRQSLNGLEEELVQLIARGHPPNGDQARTIVKDILISLGTIDQLIPALSLRGEKIPSHRREAIPVRQRINELIQEGHQRKERIKKREENIKGCISSVIIIFGLMLILLILSGM